MSLFDRIGNQQKQITMQDVQSNPVGIGRERGYDIPDSVGSNPQAIAMHLIQTGQVPIPMLQKIRPILQRLGMK